MNGEVLTSAIATGGSVASGFASNLFGMWRDKKAREWQEEMWNKQNEYNLPVNQRKRLEDAGINPNLAFGSSASAMGTSIPSSPSVHTSPLPDLGELYLKQKQVKAQIRMQNAEVNRYNEQTRQMELNNQILEQLLPHIIPTRIGDMYVQRIAQGWNEDHLRQLMDLGLTDKEVKIDLQRATKLYYDALTDFTGQKKEALIQEMEHLQKKYGFENFYYDQRINPYETSTPLGFIRSIYGPLTQWIEFLSGLIGK